MRAMGEGRLYVDGDTIEFVRMTDGKVFEVRIVEGADVRYTATGREKEAYASEMSAEEFFNEEK